MEIVDILQQWESSRSANTAASGQQYQLQPTLTDMARLQALAEMYPQHSVDTLIEKLLTAALGDAESYLSKTHNSH